MSFFDSDVVRSEIEDINELQNRIYENVFNFHLMTNKDKLEHIELLQKLLYKQKILYTRLSLSDDSEAQEMKQKIMNTAALMGISVGVDMNLVFSNMEKLIEVMKKQIDTPEEI